ncbi:MAG: DUF2231 domain-containing protein [Oscillatoria sp. PMC 1068.18]|nr:DUF2231 domain-containing protein [Oscillatoria sp. PMC 1076.18]MEC4987217.1 DUF2231 domain-containing protein [Oscillatoria sp. PMC 1068.18]
MDTTQVNEQQQDIQPPYPNIPPILESRSDEYQDSGIVSTVAIAGHPIHPIIVTFPVAFLSSAMGSDLAYWLTGDLFWARVSFWLVGVGLLSGILAAIIGMFDFTRIKRVRKRNAGWAHMYINATALVMTAINFGLRLGDLESVIVPTGLSLSIVIATLLGIGGWFGGELSFRHKVGVIGTSSRE